MEEWEIPGCWAVTSAVEASKIHAFQTQMLHQCFSIKISNKWVQKCNIVAAHLLLFQLGKTKRSDGDDERISYGYKEWRWWRKGVWVGDILCRSFRWIHERELVPLVTGGAVTLILEYTEIVPERRLCLLVNFRETKVINGVYIQWLNWLIEICIQRLNWLADSTFRDYFVIYLRTKVTTPIRDLKWLILQFMNEGC